MKTLTVDLVKMQGSYRVLAYCNDECINFETRSEDTAYSVYGIAENILQMVGAGIFANVYGGISEITGEYVIMVDFDDKTQTLQVNKNDGDAEEFLSTIADWTQSQDEDE